MNKSAFVVVRGGEGRDLTFPSFAMNAKHGQPSIGGGKELRSAFIPASGLLEMEEQKS
jgi:hypothetical protein